MLLEISNFKNGGEWWSSLFLSGNFLFQERHTHTEPGQQIISCFFLLRFFYSFFFVVVVVYLGKMRKKKQIAQRVVRLIESEDEKAVGKQLFCVNLPSITCRRHLANQRRNQEMFRS